MAVASVILDIKSNTDRALNDFKRFSAQLDNKFLISGLKLDVVRSALGQINREFQKAIGEQGLQAGSSIRAAQNQAAVLTETFKSFSSEASADMASKFSLALSSIAVNAGGTVEDIKKVMNATPWISTNLSEQVRTSMTEGMLEFQKNMRRAGLSEDFGGIAKGFLSGQLTARQMIDSGDAAQSALGLRLSKATGTPDYVQNAQQRSEALFQIISDPEFRKQLDDMAKRAYGFRGVIEDLGSRLFNPEKGVFGSLRQVTMAVGDKTTVFDETKKLIDSIFGQQGFFVNFFKQVKKIFGVEDPLKLVILGVRWITRQVNALNDFLQSPEVQAIVEVIRKAFGFIKDAFEKISSNIQENLQDPNSTINVIGTNIRTFFEDLGKNVEEQLKDPTSYLSSIRTIGISITKLFGSILDAITRGNWDPENIVESIKSIGISIRNLIMKIGDDIRSSDFSKQAEFFDEILQASVTEIFKTIGTLINEAIHTLTPDKIIGFIGLVIKTLNNAFTSSLTQIFNGNEFSGALIGALLTGGVVAAFAKTMSTGVLAFAARLIGALPFGQTVNQFIASSVRRVRGRRGNPLSEAISSVENNGVAGGRGGFQLQVLARMDRIIALLSGGTLSRGGTGGHAMPWQDSVEEAVEDSGGPNASGGGSAPRRRSAFRRGLGRIGRFAKSPVGLGIAGAAITASAIGLYASSSKASEMPGEEGIGVPKTPQKSGLGAIGDIGAGALNGAMAGSIFGPWGFAIGGLLGAGIALMDKGTRDAAGKFVSDLWNTVRRLSSNIIDGTSKFVSGFVSGIGKAAQSLVRFFVSDLPSLWIRSMQKLYIEMPLQLLKFAQTLGTSLVKSVSNFDLGAAVMNTLESIKNAAFGNSENNPERAIGGNIETSTWVGEKGMELYQPRSPGQIINNAQLQNLGAMYSNRRERNTPEKVNFEITFNVTGGLSADNVDQLKGPVLSIIQQAWEEVTSATVSRGASVA